VLYISHTEERSTCNKDEEYILCPIADECKDPSINLTDEDIHKSDKLGRIHEVSQKRGPYMYFKN
jgi:hypothetical protein